MKKQLLFMLIVSSYFFGVQNTFSQLRFTENKGQWDEKVQYRANIQAGYLHLYRTSFIYTYYDAKKLGNLHLSGTQNRTHHGKTNLNTSVPIREMIAAHGVQVRLVGTQENSILIPEQKHDQIYNYFLGKNSKGSRVKTFGKVTYQNIYSQTDLIFYDQDNHLKYEFVLAPKAKTKKIAMQYIGADTIFLKNGNLHVRTSLNEVIEQKPYSYQLIKGKKIEVPCAFKLERNIVRFVFAKGYNKKYPLVIDPVLVFATYSGSAADNWGNTATFDIQGNLYSGGSVFGINFPVSVGAYQVNFSGQIDVGILKFDSLGTDLIYATYLGGERSDVPISLIVNNSGSLIILGVTSSENFPTGPLSYNATFSGGDPITPLGSMPFNNGTDIFVASLDSSGEQLLNATYIGGSANDGINGEAPNANNGILNRNYGDEYRADVIVDNDDNVYVVSNTRSFDFPVTITGTLQGVQDGVLFKLNKELSTLEWSRYLGGSANDAIYSVKLDTSGNIIIAGGTNSLDFPTTSGVLHENILGNVDGFVSVLSNAGDTVIASTYLGTNNYDQVYFIDVDRDRNIACYGQTSGSYPITSGVYSNPNSGQFIHKLNSELSNTIFSTVVGSRRGTPDICPTAFLLNSCSHIYVAGWGSDIGEPGHFLGSTNSMPVLDADQSTTDGNDFYMAVLSSDASELLYATYLGGISGPGEHVDGGTCRFDKNGIVYHAVCACRDLSSFPTTPGAWSNVNRSSNCNNAAFKFDLATLKAQFQVVEDEAICAPKTVNFNNLSIGGTSFLWRFGDGTTSTEANDVSHTYTQPGTYDVTLRIEDEATCRVLDVFVATIEVSPQNFGVGQRVHTICYNDSVQLSAFGGDFGSYTWTPATGLNSDTIANPIASPDITTTYNVRIVNEHGCMVDSQFVVNVLPELSAEFEVQEFAQCGSIDFVVLQDLSTGADSYTWDLGDGRVFQNQFPGDTITYQDGSYTIRLTVQNSNGCTEQKEMPITIQQLTTDFNIFSDYQCGELPTISFENLSTLGAVSTWDFGDGTSFQGTTPPAHIYSEPANYTVRLHTELSGCIGMKENSIFIESVTPPNVFTPNSDNLNETFVIPSQFSGWKLVVNNRWGEVVYESDNYQNDWSAEGLPSGTYYYRIVRDEQSCKGAVKIIR